MSMASYFFVGTPDEAVRNDGLADGPPERRAEFYRVTDSDLESLYSVMSGQECPELTPAAMSEDFDQITFEVPEEFVDRLALLKSSEIDEVISEWKEADSVPYDNDSDLNDLLKALVRLATVAQQAKLNLYVWICI